jgi:hypothetical protein
MDISLLKQHAELLENAIQANLGKNKDVDWLAMYPPLIKALKDAKESKIDAPRELGLARWEIESNIQNTREVSHRLAQFEILLDGWSLPSKS